MTPTLPIIDIDQAGRLMRRVEAHHDLDGWHDHGNTHIYVVYERCDVVTADAITKVMSGMGPEIRNSRYAAQTMLPPRMFRQAHMSTGRYDPENLRIFARNTAFAITEKLDDPQLAMHLESFRHLLRIPGIHGFLACYEAHGIEGDTAAAAMLRALTGNERIEHMPGAREIRIVSMVDALSRVHIVTRWRGEAAELDMDTALVGDVTTSLQILMDTAIDQLPADQAAHDARYISLKEHLASKGIR